MKNLKNLWFLVTGFNCNLKCKHCYLGCSPSNKSRNFLNLDKIRKTIDAVKQEGFEEIYLTGGEPLLHRDINNIIKYCINFSNVIILTNATLINDKKARFLRQIEVASDFEIIFRVSLDHYKEIKNDEIRGKGTFRKTLSGINNLVNNGFSPIISAVNIWNEDENLFRSGFEELLTGVNIESSELNLKIIPAVKTGSYAINYSSYNDNEFPIAENFNRCEQINFDCVNSRVVSDDGIYICPALLNDPRGKIGDKISDASKKFFLEPNPCYTCQTSNQKIFNNDWAS
jgi:MoaA/NifB/PqqE/SkfB family radical SAM enzyme